MTATGEALLSAHELVVRHHGRPPVLDGASFRAAEGARVALLGANGAGKTTLLRCLSGALRAESGQVLLGAQVLRHNRAALRQHRTRVQLVLQDPDDQLFSADVTQDVSFGPLNLGLDEAQARDRVRESLALLGIEHLAERPTHQLSQGERKRVTLAGAIAMRPQVLLLDEPTAGLDPRGVIELLAALERVSATVVFATHDVDLALLWADTVAIIHQRRVRQGTIGLLGDASLLASAHLRRPWQLDMVEALGHDPAVLAPCTIPRTAADVVALALPRQGRAGS